MEGLGAELSGREKRKLEQLRGILQRQESRDLRNKAWEILNKDPDHRSLKDLSFIEKNSRIVAKIETVLHEQRLEKERRKEIFDSAADLMQKSMVLADVIKEAKHLVIYTGAGISTAADIPDYRGPDGLWTRSQKGETVTNPMNSLDLTKAKPTFTHMALVKLHEAGFVKHIVSQNCDGLHVRSGFPRTSLSEIHGNMFLEMCPECDPHGEYFRSFDVTGKTRWRRHRTGRFCINCNEQLTDTIVLFGEKSRTEIPMRWQSASDQVAQADVIICLGSSLQVLKDYPTLWSSNSRLFIVNLQWTPKDFACELKIHGRCDDIMKHVMSRLELQPDEYNEGNDPLLTLAVPLKPGEYSGEEAGLRKRGWLGQGLKTVAFPKDSSSERKVKTRKKQM